MKTLPILLLSLLLFSGCSKKNDVFTVIPVSRDTDTVTYLALGDSYTIGTSSVLSESYPYQLITALNNDSIPAVNPTIIAFNGWNTFDLISGIEAAHITGKNYSIVTLLIGVNDEYEGISTDMYRTNFIKLLHTAVGFANNNVSRVFVLSIPDWGVTPAGNGRDNVIGPDIDRFNVVNQEETEKIDANYIDVTTISRLAANDPTLIASDNLHPSAKMYAMWVKELEPLVKQRLYR